MKLPREELENIRYFRVDLNVREKAMWRPDDYYDKITVHWKPEPIVGEWAEWGIFYYLFGWLRKIKRENKDTFTFRRIQSATENPELIDYKMQPDCEELIRQLKRYDATQARA